MLSPGLQSAGGHQIAIRAVPNGAAVWVWLGSLSLWTFRRGPTRGLHCVGRAGAGLPVGNGSVGRVAGMAGLAGWLDRVTAWLPLWDDGLSGPWQDGGTLQPAM